MRDVNDPGFLPVERRLQQGRTCMKKRVAIYLRVRSPVSSAFGEVVPRIIIQSSHLRVGEFESHLAKRLSQQYLPRGDIQNERGRQLRRPYRMNTRMSAIATSVYVLVTVMPRYSRSILSSILQGKPRSEPGAGPYTENGPQYPGLVYSEVNTPLNDRRKRNLRVRHRKARGAWGVLTSTSSRPRRAQARQRIWFVLRQTGIEQAPQ
jgi:hypothetical protein